MEVRGVSTWVAGGVLTLNSGLALYRSKGDAGAVAFVVVSYSALLILLASLRAFERAAPGSPARGRLKRAVWALSTLLTAMFSWKVAGLMPSTVAAVVWGLAVATSLGGLFALFVQG